MASNRRPGDWDCPACNVHNFASRTSCFKCHTPKPAELGGDEGGYGAGPQRWGGRQRDRRPGDWDCPNCGAHCFASRTRCFQCNADRPAGMGLDPYVQFPSRGYNDGYGGGQGGMRGDRRPGDWECPKCGVNNFASREMCFKCNTAKPQPMPEGETPAPEFGFGFGFNGGFNGGFAAGPGPQPPVNEMPGYSNPSEQIHGSGFGTLGGFGNAPYSNF